MESGETPKERRSGQRTATLERIGREATQGNDEDAEAQNNLTKTMSKTPVDILISEKVSDTLNWPRPLPASSK